MNKVLKITLLLLLSVVFTTGTAGNRINITGKVTAEGKGIGSVPVTDGENIVFTDKNGNYKLETYVDRGYVYYTLPSGYESPVNEGTPLFYEKIDTGKKTQKINFELKKATRSQQKHAFIAWADPQILQNDELELLDKVIADVVKTKSTFPASVPVHAISLGDNIFDRQELFDGYKKRVATVGLPFYHALGNHDMDYNNRSNELSAITYSKVFGPAYYSFNIGKVHYVVLKDVFYYGYTFRYIGYIDERQLSWLEKDLASVKPGSTVVVSLHIPVVYGETEKPSGTYDLLPNQVMNYETLFKILSPFQTHFLAGHSHTQWNAIHKPNVFEHVHAAACASWWEDEISIDGTPKGYTVYEVNGDSLSWYFKGVNLDKNEQFRLYPINTDTANPGDIIANVFNYDTNWKVYWYENDVLKGEMTLYWGKDPYAENRYTPEKNKRHAWVGPSMTHHLFRATPENKNSKITVKVVDRFGNAYTKTIDKKL